MTSNFFKGFGPKRIGAEPSSIYHSRLVDLLPKNVVEQKWLWIYVHIKGPSASGWLLDPPAFFCTWMLNDSQRGQVCCRCIPKSWRLCERIRNRRWKWWKRRKCSKIKRIKRPGELSAPHCAWVGWGNDSTDFHPWILPKEPESIKDQGEMAWLGWVGHIKDGEDIMTRWWSFIPDSSIQEFWSNHLNCAMIGKPKGVKIQFLWDRNWQTEHLRVASWFCCCFTAGFSSDSSCCRGYGDRPERCDLWFASFVEYAAAAISPQVKSRTPLCWRELSVTQRNRCCGVGRICRSMKLALAG